MLHAEIQPIFSIEDYDVKSGLPAWNKFIFGRAVCKFSYFYFFNLIFQADPERNDQCATVFKRRCDFIPIE